IGELRGKATLGFEPQLSEHRDEHEKPYETDGHEDRETPKDGREAVSHCGSLLEFGAALGWLVRLVASPSPPAGLESAVAAPAALVSAGSAPEPVRRTVPLRAWVPAPAAHLVVARAE